jgi:hypothetical protein
MHTHRQTLFHPLPTPTPTEIPLAVLMRAEEKTMVASNDTGDVSANCPSGTFPVGGGFSIEPEVHVITHSQEGAGWRARAINPHDDPVVLWAIATCASNIPGANVQVSVGEATAPSNDIGHAVASCPEGTTGLSGGYHLGFTDQINVYNST